MNIRLSLVAFCLTTATGISSTDAANAHRSKIKASDACNLNIGELEPGDIFRIETRPNQFFVLREGFDQASIQEKGVLQLPVIEVASRKFLAGKHDYTVTMGATGGPKLNTVIRKVQRIGKVKLETGERQGRDPQASTTIVSIVEIDREAMQAELVRHLDVEVRTLPPFSLFRVSQGKHRNHQVLLMGGLSADQTQVHAKGVQLSERHDTATLKVRKRTILLPADTVVTPVEYFLVEQ